MDEIPQNSDGVPSPSGALIDAPERQKKRRKTKFWILLGLGVVFLAVLIFNPFSRIFFGVLVDHVKSKSSRVKLQIPEVYQPVGPKVGHLLPV